METSKSVTELSKLSITMISKSTLVLAATLATLASADRLFTVNCNPLTIQRGDPIVSPGKLSSHVHAISGSQAFNLTETNLQAINAPNTTCDKTLDHSNYWVPQLYHQRTDGLFEIVTFQGNVSILGAPSLAKKRETI